LMSSSATSSSSARSKTPSFIAEVPLVAGPCELRTVNVRLDYAARSIYNACLGRALKSGRRLQESCAFRKIREINREIRVLLKKRQPEDLPPQERLRLEALRQARRELWQRAACASDFTSAALQRFAVVVRNQAFREHLDVHTAQKLAVRAYHATREHILGRRGRPRFKGPRQLDTVEGKSNHAGIRWREDRVEWFGLVLPARIDPKDEVIQHALNCRIKYVRLVRRKGKRDRLYAQLVCEGKPFRKSQNTLREGVVGIDGGPSMLARVSDREARLDRFCTQLRRKHKKIRCLQRKLDRSRRTSNPHNYNPDGTVKKGARRWKKTKTCIKTEVELLELYRKEVAHRRCLVGRLVNETLRMGSVFKYEKISWKALQRRYGRSVGLRAPGMFFRELSRKAESAGGTVVEFPTRVPVLSTQDLKVGLSSFCHHCRTREKKPLSCRWHICSCGVHVQRDLYSAYLARFVERDEGGRFWLDAGSAARQWPGAEPLLQAASSLPPNPRVPASSGQPRKGTEGVAAEERMNAAEARDAVAPPSGGGESPGEAAGTLLRTPGL
jgi:putative transposase